MRQSFPVAFIWIFDLSNLIHAGKHMELKTCIILLISIFAVGQNPLLSQDWEATVQKRIEYLEQKNGTGTNLDLQKRLLQMKEKDQVLRMKMIDNPESEKVIQQLEAVDKELTAELKKIVQMYGWPTIRLVGLEASQSAALILNHSADHDFQREWIPKLQDLVDQEEIVGSDLALIIDKVLLSEGKPQLFGNVFRFDGDFMIMQPIRDPERLDERRAKYLLPPIKEYIKFMEEIYHKKLK